MDKENKRLALIALLSALFFGILQYTEKIGPSKEVEFSLVLPVISAVFYKISLAFFIIYLIGFGLNTLHSLKWNPLKNTYTLFYDFGIVLLMLIAYLSFGIILLLQWIVTIINKFGITQPEIQPLFNIGLAVWLLVGILITWKPFSDIVKKTYSHIAKNIADYIVSKKTKKKDTPKSFS